MPVNHEIKSQLAKLLATEDLVVEHKKVETACFNVHTRVLTLPMWEKASNIVYDLLVGHEVGHALFTPDEEWSKNRKVPAQFVNVTEDARVEKLMKRRYAGLAKTFYGGYKELSDEDFFQLGDEDVDEMNLADRANLYFKIGNFLSLDFTVKEQEIIDQIGAAETFAEALDAAEALYKYCKQKQQEETKIQIDNLESQQSGSNQSASDFSDQQEGENDQPETEGGDGSSSNQDGEQKSQEQQKQEVKSEQGGETSEPWVKTVDNLEEALKDLVNQDTYENVYVEIPKVNLKQIIVNNAEVHNKCKESWKSYLDKNEYEPGQIFGAVDKDYREFKRSAQKEVNYLVKEFECRKAADSYARATTARTGILDCTKLHTYKYNEDLFRKVTTLATGKNHGLIFILDWSGSMNDVMLDTVKQLFNLVWFCRKVSIPFEVYAFTSDYPTIKYDENHKPIMPEPLYQKKSGLIHIHENFSLMNMLTSKTNSSTTEQQMLNIYRVANSFSNGANYYTPVGWSLSGTPLNESLVALHEILPTFQKENKLQKVQCVVLTDGEAHSLKYHVEFNRTYDKEPYLGLNALPSNSFLRDRKTGHTYSLKSDLTKVLLHNLRDKFPSVNFIGMRILQSRDVGYFVRGFTGWVSSDYEKIMNSWKKEKSFSIKNSGYHTYFGLSSSALSNDAEFEVASDATKTQIKSAFVKSLKTKKMNKKVLSEFMELVA
tara:strand:- start:963 stop:3107 length:2145 start_codon:yes stop_codon:yes gene_type:complete